MALNEVRFQGPEVQAIRVVNAAPYVANRDDFDTVARQGQGGDRADVAKTLDHRGAPGQVTQRSFGTHTKTRLLHQVPRWIAGNRKLREHDHPRTLRIGPRREHAIGKPAAMASSRMLGMFSQLEANTFMSALA